MVGRRRVIKVLKTEWGGRALEPGLSEMPSIPRRDAGCRCPSSASGFLCRTHHSRTGGICDCPHSACCSVGVHSDEPTQDALASSLVITFQLRYASSGTMPSTGTLLVAILFVIHLASGGKLRCRRTGSLVLTLSTSGRRSHRRSGRMPRSYWMTGVRHWSTSPHRWCLPSHPWLGPSVAEISVRMSRR